MQVCDAVASLRSYSQVQIDWDHADNPYCGGLVACGAPVAPGCGNGVIDPAAVPPEICDGSDFGGATCASLVPGTTGNLACLNSCQLISTTGCLPGGSPYVDILSTALTPLPSSIQQSSISTVGVQLNDLVLANTSYLGMSSVQLIAICEDLPGSNDLCERIDNTPAGYDLVVQELLNPSNPKLFPAATMHVIQYGVLLTTQLFRRPMRWWYRMRSLVRLLKLYKMCPQSILKI